MKQKLVNRILADYGSWTHFAKSIGVARDVVVNWIRRGIPVEACLNISTKTGYRLQDLNEFFKPVTKIIRAEIERGE